MGKLLIAFGLLLVVVGGLLALAGTLGAKLPFVGRLPGDISIQRENWSFFFPITTSILLSVILTLIVTLFSRR